MDTATQVRLTTGWRHLPPVHFVPTHLDLPGRHDAATRGLWTPGGVFIVTQQPANRIPSVLAHEVVAHGAVRSLLGREAWGSFMDSVQRGARADPGLRSLRMCVRADYGRLRPRLEADEMGAALVELHANPVTGVFEPENPARKRLVALVNHLARERLFLDVPATADEFEGLLAEAQALYRSGPPFWAAQPWWYPASTMPTPKPMGPRKPASSLAESEAMLNAERLRLRAPDEWRAMALIVGGWLAAALACSSVIYLLLLVLGIVRL